MTSPASQPFQLLHSFAINHGLYCGKSPAALLNFSFSMNSHQNFLVSGSFVTFYASGTRMAEWPGFLPVPPWLHDAGTDFGSDREHDFLISLLFGYISVHLASWFLLLTIYLFPLKQVLVIWKFYYVLRTLLFRVEKATVKECLSLCLFFFLFAWQNIRGLTSIFF